MKTRTVLVTGSTGMLGRQVCALLSPLPEFALIGITKDLLPDGTRGNHYNIDITDKPVLDSFLETKMPDVIIHTAANVNVDDCEKNREKAYTLHVDATRSLASFNNGKTRLIHISTDSVFDGKNGQYCEDDTPNPLNFYAETKLLGEEVALSANKNAIVLRTNIIGYHVPFGRSLSEWLISNLETGGPLNGFTDIFFNPLYTGQLSTIILHLMNDASRTGILNCASDKVVSKYEFALMVAKEFGFSGELVKAMPYKEEISSAARPRNTSLSTKRFESIFGHAPSLSEGVRQMRADLLNDRAGGQT